MAVDPATLNVGEPLVLDIPSDPHLHGLAVKFASIVGGTDGKELCVGADLLDAADRGLLCAVDDGGGMVVPTKFVARFITVGRPDLNAEYRITPRWGAESRSWVYDLDFVCVEGHFDEGGIEPATSVQSFFEATEYATKHQREGSVA